MTWHELRVVVPATAVEVLSARLFALGASGVQEAYVDGQAPPPRQPWDSGPEAPEPEVRVVIAWFDEKPDLTAALPPDSQDVSWSPMEDVDWENDWKRSFQPIVISDRLTIAPPWENIPNALIIEPGQGFGTGLHPSTQAALRLMEDVYPSTRTCLDLGCGSGILALAASQRGLVAHGVDVEESAVQEARRHAKLNGLSATFDATPIREITGTWDLVAANLHAELLVEFASDLDRLTGEWLICAGILADREHKVRERLDPLLILDAEEREGEWVALRYRRVQR